MTTKFRIKYKEFLTASCVCLFIFLGSFITHADVTSGLVGHWEFNEGSGSSTADSSGNGYNGIFQGGANAPVWIAGNGTPGSGAVHFIGNGSSVSLPTIPFGDAYSFSFWIRNDANTENFTSSLNVISWGWYISLSYYSKALHFTVAGDSSKSIGSSCINNGNNNSGWHHIVATNDGSTQNLYCDGSLVGTSQYTPASNGATGSPLYFAASPTGGGGNYTGYFNDVRIYDRVLSAADINTLFTSGVQPNLGPLPNPTVLTANLFIAQTAQGTQDGSSCANAQSVAWLDNQGNWGNQSGQIGSGGGTINLCGTITSTVQIYNGGVSGNPLTVFFQPNAKISQAAGTGINANGVSYLTIDGGTNGIIENTDNGTPGTVNGVSTGVTNPLTGNPYGNQVGTSGIYAPGSSNLEIKNLTIQNLYVHASPLDNGPDLSAVGAFYGGGSHISIHDNTFHDICWVLPLGLASGGSGINIYNNNFYNYDHGVAGIGGSGASPANVNIFNNHFGSTANWDTNSNTWHHDGIHIFFAPGGSISGVNIYNNLFDGNWGNNNTAHIFLEGDWSHPNYATMSNFNIYNNVFIQYPNDYLNDGFLAGGGLNFNIYNNTVLGAGIRNSGCFDIGSYGGMNFKNNILSGCTTFISFTAGTFSGLDNNIYANATPGGNPTWGYEVSPETDPINTFLVWQQFTGMDQHSLYVTSPGLDSNGYLQAGSAAIGAGANLTNVGIVPLNSDKNGISRSNTLPWDIGAYTYGSTPSNYSLTVTTAGNGYGQVFGSTPNSSDLINCGVNLVPSDEVCNATVDNGVTVTLTATPASGYSFAGWSGGTCNGTGTCLVSTNANVTATFNSVLVNGVCGSADQTYLYNATGFGSGTFCRSGNLNPAAVTFPQAGKSVTWTCVGSNGGFNSTCKAKRNSRTMVKLL